MGQDPVNWEGQDHIEEGSSSSIHCFLFPNCGHKLASCLKLWVCLSCCGKRYHQSVNQNQPLLWKSLLLGTLLQPQDKGLTQNKALYCLILGNHGRACKNLTLGRSCWCPSQVYLQTEPWNSFCAGAVRAPLALDISVGQHVQVTRQGHLPYHLALFTVCLP